MAPRNRQRRDALTALDAVLARLRARRAANPLNRLEPLDREAYEQWRRGKSGEDEYAALVSGTHPLYPEGGFLYDGPQPDADDRDVQTEYYEMIGIR